MSELLPRAARRSDGASTQGASPTASPAGGRVRRAFDYAEAHPVAFVFALACAVRVMLAVAINLRTGGSLVPDDVTYQDIAAAKATGHTATWDERTYFLYHSTQTFIAPLATIYSIFGPHRLLGQLVAALWGATTAGAVVALARRVQPARWAMAAGIVVALMPSQILWSALTLKDAAVWAVLALLAVAVSRALASEGSRLLGWGVAICVLLLMMSRLRDHTFMVATIALVLTSWAGSRVATKSRIAGALLIAVTLPWMAGLGIGGIDFLRNAGSLEERRYNNAIGAKSALVPVAPPGAAPGDPASAGTPANSAKPQPVLETDPSTEAGADVRHLPRGLEAMLLQPFPVGRATSTGLKLARAETLVWYPVLLLAVLGLLPALRARRTYLFPLIAGSGVCVLYALAEGNLGTAYRHRGEFVWVVALLAGAGAQVLAARLARRRAAAHAVPDAPYTEDNSVPEAGADTRRYA